MKKITFFLLMFAITLGTLKTNAQIIDVDWAAGTPTGWPAPANNITVPSPWTITGEAGSDFLSFGGANGLKLRTLNTSDDLWLGYHATGLTMGANYKIESTLRTQNNKVDMTLYAWPESEGNSPSGVTVLGSPLAGFVDNADTAYSITFEATSTSMVFGVGVNRNAGSPTSIVRSFKVTEVAGGSASTETDITAFTLAAQTGAASIDTDAHTVAIEVAYSNVLTSLSPTITLSSGATVSPDTGVAQDFSGGAVNYTVTAEDGVTNQVWAVTVTEAAASTETDITGFTLSEQAGSATINTGAHTVAIEVTNGTALTSLTPTITLSSGATVSPNTGVTQDFSSSVNYTVTAEDGTTSQVWAVTVTEAAASLNVFEFDLANQTESDAFVASLPSGFASTGTITSNQWGGTYGVRINGNSSLTYSATGLSAGNYTLEANVMVQNVDHTWIQDVWETGGTVATPIVQTGTAGSFVTYSKEVTVPSSGNYTFGIVRGNHGSQLYVQSWKLIAPATTVTSTGDGTWAAAAFGGTAPTAINNVVIDNAINIPSGTNATVNNLTIGTGSLTIASGGTLIVNGTSTGNVAYQRTLTSTSDGAAANLEGWFSVTPPVSGEALNTAWADANSLATGTGSNRGLATYTENGDTWSYFDGTATTFEAGKGYIVKRTTDGTVTFTGTVNTSDAGVDVNVTKDGNGFNLLGSPYTAKINSATFLSDNSANLAIQQIWIWNDNGNTYNAQTAASNFMLSPGQGFFVQASASATLNFAESNQSGGTDTFQKSVKTKVRLNVFNGKTNRYAEVYYLKDASKSYDTGFEGETFGGIPDHFSIYTQLLEDNQDKNYQIQSLPNSDLESMIVPVGLKISGNEEITFTAEASNIPSGLKVFLEDRLENTFTRLDELNAEYKIAISESSNGIGRFYLHTRSNALSVSDDALLNSVSVFKTNASTLRIAGLSHGKASVKLYNVLGKQIINSSFQANGVKDIHLPSLAKGIYIFQLETEAGSKLSKKLILE